jgi:hypothetical protein
MRKLSITIGGVLLGAGLCLTAYAADAAAPVKGTWSLNNWTPGDTAHLTLAYRNATTRWEWGNDQPLEDLHGLTSEQRHSAHVSVSFTMDRDAGTFAFEGTLTLGLGRGEFRFVPNPTYAAKLSVLGYETIGEGELLGMALRDVSLAFASEVKFSGLKEVTVSDLMRLKDHGVGLDFIRALATIGATNLTADDVVRFRDHGIDGEFVRALRSPGAPALSADDIIKLHDHGVKPEYVARIQSAGYPDLTVDQIIKLHDHGVD